MAQLVLENFRYGQEYRRSELTANPGSLFDSLNCFVNEGGEMERRRALYPMTAANSTYGLIQPDFPSGSGVSWVEFENSGAVFFGSVTPTPGVLPAAYAGTGNNAASYVYNLLQVGLARVVDITNPSGGASFHISSLFGYNVTVTTLTNTSATGVIAYTNNTSSNVTVTFSGTWVAGDHIKLRVAQTNYTTDIGYGVTMTNYPSFTRYNIFGGGLTVPSCFCLLQDPTDTSATITDIVTCTFAGKVFALVTWSTGHVFAYYQGLIIPDFVGGYIFSNIAGNNNSIAAALAAVINGQNGLTATVVGAVITVTHSGDSIGVTITKTSASGTVNIVNSGTATVTVTIGGTWATGDYMQSIVIGVVGAGADHQYGTPDVTLVGVAYTFCLAYGTKIYLLAGTKTYYSAANSAIDFHTTASGAGNIDLAKQDSVVDTLVTACPYQGYLAFFFRNSIQIWSLASDDSLDQRIQALGNTGAVGRFAVCPLGNLDVIYVDSGGIRSLRPRVASNNALPFDVGAPINKQVRTQLRASTCVNDKIVLGYDPTNQLLFVTIPYSNASNSVPYYNCSMACWVLSYFPDSKVVAWTSIDFKWASNEGPLAAQKQMWPIKFVTWYGALYFLGQYQYTATSAGTVRSLCLGVYDPSNLGRVLYSAGWDNAISFFTTPYLSAKSPGVKKQSSGADIIVTGGWTLAACMSPGDGTLTNIVTVGSAGTSSVVDSSTPDGPGIPFDTWGNHIQFRFTGTVDNTATDLGTLTTTPGQQIASQLIWYYEIGGAKE